MTTRDVISQKYSLFFLGMLVKPNSNRYEGSWLNDLKHGKGKYWHLRTGQLQKGVWIENICVFSTFNDVKYRQSALFPTPFPIHKVNMYSKNV